MGEYIEDKFVPSNNLKRLLGKMGFYQGRDRNGGSKIDRLNIIDVELASGKKLSEIKTLWGQSLVDFHHDLFEKTYKSFKELNLFDISSWYHRQGVSAKNYYASLLALAIRNVILFENFDLGDKQEKVFSKNIVLPAIIEVMKKLGVKPLIVALEPTEIEGSKFWICHPPETRGFIEKQQGGLNQKN